jgi:CRP-like cAMP-binding protein
MDPISAHLEAVKAICPEIEQSELDWYRRGLVLRSLPAKAVYIAEGQVQTEIAFVAEGLMRSSYTDADGNDITTHFVAERQWATEYASFLRGTPSHYRLECLEPCTLVCLPKSHMEEGYRRFPVFERYGRKVAEAVLSSLQKRIESFLFMNAEQRYLQFMEENPGLMQRISLTHLSASLGIERPSLSRIRKKLAGQ